MVKSIQMLCVLLLADGCTLHDPGWRREIWDNWGVESVHIINGTASVEKGSREVIAEIPTCRMSILAYFPDTQAVVNLSVPDGCRSDLLSVESFALAKPPPKLRIHVFGRKAVKGFCQLPCPLNSVLKIELFPLERRFNPRFGVRFKFRARAEESVLEVVWKDPWPNDEG